MQPHAEHMRLRGQLLRPHAERVRLHERLMRSLEEHMRPLEERMRSLEERRQPHEERRRTLISRPLSFPAEIRRFSLTRRMCAVDVEFTGVRLRKIFEVK
jgi:hypothetical protein